MKTGFARTGLYHRLGAGRGLDVRPDFTYTGCHRTRVGVPCSPIKREARFSPLGISCVRYNPENGLLFQEQANIFCKGADRENILVFESRVVCLQRLSSAIVTKSSHADLQMSVPIKLYLQRQAMGRATLGHWPWLAHSHSSLTPPLTCCLEGRINQWQGTTSW